MARTRTLLKEIAMHSPNTTHQSAHSESRNTALRQFTLRGNREFISACIGSSSWHNTLRLQAKLERTYRQKKKTNRLKNKRDQLVDRKKSHLSIENKLLIYKAVFKPTWRYGI